MQTTLINPVQAHQAFKTAWIYAKARLMADHRLVLSVKEEKRSDAQNRRLWAMLTDVSQQVVWHGRKLTPDDWKHIFSASLKKQDAVQGIDGGFVVLGLSTSKMTKAEMADMQTLMEAFGVNHGVKFRAQDDQS